MDALGEDHRRAMDRPSSASNDSRHGRWRHWVPDAVGVVWVVAAAGAVLLPALLHGQSLGPYNLLSGFGLSRTPGAVFYNGRGSDQIEQMIPWTTLAWTQVHHGQLPLWNPYSALGMPLAFNWQSATFGVPALVGYLFPLRLAYTAQIVTTLVIAGSGVYVLGRVLRCGVLASVFAGTVFELSGAFMAWLGWPISSVMSWVGWLFAAAILVIRGAHRARDIFFFAVVLALAVYAGQPDALSVLAVAFAVFLVVVFVLRVPRLGGSGVILRAVLDLVVATIAGIALAAPLALPGFQLTRMSTRIVSGRAFSGDQAVPLYYLPHFLFPGLNGYLVTGDTAYMGVIVVVLAVGAVGMRWRQPEIVALVAVGIVMVGLSFSQPVISAATKLVGSQTVRWPRAIVLVAFAVAILAGLGMDVLVRAWRDRAVVRWLGAGFLVAGAVLFVLLLVGGGDLSGALAATRATNFIWPTVQIALGLAVIGILALARTRPKWQRARSLLRWADLGWWAALAMLLCETAFLVGVGAPLWTSSSSYLPSTATEVAFKRAVGSSIVGNGVPEACITLGIRVNLNVVYGIQEFAVYDPMIPRAYFQTWKASTGQPQRVAGYPQYSFFCPGVTSAAEGRRFGVSFVLEPHGAPGPRGAVFDTTVGGEDLYRVPGAAAATLTPVTASGGLPSPDARGTAVAVTHPDPASWKLEVHARSSSVLRLRLTAAPGWRGSIDGKPLVLTRFSGVMLQARIPAGAHTVELRYWPSTFTDGIVLAVCSAAGLALGLVVTWRTRLRRPRITAPSPP